MLLYPSLLLFPPPFASPADASIDTEFSGTTGVMAAIRKRTLSVANIGDSRCILGRKEGSGPLTAVPVSDDHKPDRPDEQRRIVSKGGRVFAVEYEDGVDGPPRVWLGHMDIPGLAMSRSLGDTVAHTAGVISNPEMHVVELTPADKVIVIASDGLWEFMSNQEVLDMIAGVDDPRRAVDMLVAEANARWMKEEQVVDDTTVIVAFLDVNAAAASGGGSGAAAGASAASGGGSGGGSALGSSSIASSLFRRS